MATLPQKLLPMLAWWPRVTKETLRHDALAGLSGAIIVLPQGVAYATIAGMPPVYGLYAAMVPAVVASLFGSSWHLVSGPTAAISLVVFAAVAALAQPASAEYVSLVLTLTLLVGVFQLALGMARLGAFVNFVSHTVVIGFTAGAAVLIAVSQLTNFFGVPGPGSSSFVSMAGSFLGHIGKINPYITAVGAVTLAAAILVRKYFRKIPYMIVAMLAGSLFAAALNAVLGAQATGIPVVGALPNGLPPFSHADLTTPHLQQIATAALAITMLGLTEAVSIARAIALRSEQPIDGNQEFIGQGLSNIAGSFFSGYASSGSFTRSGVNYDAGARTPLASVFASLFLVLIVLAVAPLVAFLPIAAMAAVLFMVAWSLIDLHHIRSILQVSRAETAVLLATFLATLFVQLEFAIYVGVVLSLMLFLERTSRPEIRDAMPAPEEDTYHFVPNTSGKECCQLKILFVDGAIFFGAVNHLQQALRRIDEVDPSQKHVLLLAPGVSFIDVAGAEMLAQEARRRRKMGGALYFHRLQPAVVQMLAKGGYLKDIGEENLYPMGPRVIDAIYPRLDSDVCRTCPTRVFSQCSVALPNGKPRDATATSTPSTERTSRIEH